MISQEELKQLKAFTRYDGFVLGILMSATFVMMMGSITRPGMQLIALGLLVATPFFVGNRVCHYRDSVVMKKVSYRRALFYALECFLYGGLILGVAGYAYMRFIDGGAFLTSMTESLRLPEMQPVLTAYGLNADDLINVMAEQRPIDIAFSLISNVIVTGFFTSLIIALFVRRDPITKKIKK